MGQNTSLLTRGRSSCSIAPAANYVEAAALNDLGAVIQGHPRTRLVQGHSALCSAAASGSVRTLQWLVVHGRVCIKTNAYEALWCAFIYGQLDCALALLEHCERSTFNWAVYSRISKHKLKFPDVADVDRFRAMCTRLFVDGDLEFRYDYGPAEFIRGCYGRLENHPLEALVEAALDAGVWAPEDMDFLVCADQLGLYRRDCRCDILFEIAHVGFAGIVARLLKDPRTSPANAVEGWYTSGRGWFGDIDYYMGPLSARRRKIMFEVLAADERCRAELVAQRPRILLEDEKTLLASLETENADADCSQ